MKAPTPKKSTIAAALVAIAACSMTLSSDKDIQLMPGGSFRALDGRPADAPGWRLDAALAADLVAAVNARINPYVIDYEHQTLRSVQNGKPAPAAGWFSKVEWRDGSGLWAIDVEWTAAARAMIDAGEYKFISPVIAYDKTGAVTGLLMAAITNNAAIDGMNPVMLAAASQQYAALNSTTSLIQEPQMDALLEQLRWMLNLPVASTPEDILAQLTKLGDMIRQDQAAEGSTAAANCDLVALFSNHRTKIASLSAAVPDPAKFVPIATMQSMQTQLADLSAKLSTKSLDELVSGALAGGKLLPAQEEWARTWGAKDLAALSAYIENAQPLAALSGLQTQGKLPAPAQKIAALTASQKDMCEAMGVPEADYLKTLQAEAQV